jgi:hypothetical protein
LAAPKVAQTPTPAPVARKSLWRTLVLYVSFAVLSCAPVRTPSERAPIMSDAIPLTYRELAERLGLSPDSARIKAKRRKWQAIPGNHPSEPVRVLVPVEFLNGERTPERKAGERTPSVPPESMGEINAFRAHVETLKQQLEQQRTDHQAERERLNREVDRAQAELDRLRDELEREREHGRDLAGRLDTAHRDRGGEAARLRQEIDAIRTELARPWWRRLWGSGG